MNSEFKVGDTIRVIRARSVRLLNATGIVVSEEEFNSYWEPRGIKLDPSQIPMKLDINIMASNLYEAPPDCIEHCDYRLIRLEADIVEFIENNRLDVDIILKQVLKIKEEPEQEKIRYIEL